MAIRRHLYQDLEEDLIIEDFVLSLRVVEKGWRAVYEPEAVAWEEEVPSLRGDWIRHTRIAAGGFQSLSRLRSLARLKPALQGFQFWSHRMLRWVVTPCCWGIMLGSNAVLASRPLYGLLLALQFVFYVLAGAGYVVVRSGRRYKLLQIPLFMCLLNGAALVGGYRYLTGRQSVLWERARS